MAKQHSKAVSVLLASMMIASMCCVSTTATAATTNKEESGASLAKYYSTNANGTGKNKTISVDGDISDWDSSMLIAQGTANDDPRVYRPNSMYELPIDLYALYGAYDDNNVYLMWEMTNVQDVVAPNDDYPLSQGILWQTQELPFFIAVDTGKSSDAIGNNGALTTGGTIWNSGMTIGNSFNKLISINTKGGNGPWVYGGDSTGLNPVEQLDASTSNIKMDYGLGILSDKVYGINGAYGTNNGRVPGDVCSESSDWVDFKTKGHNSSKMDFFYELSIPYDELGITKSDVESNGIGVLLVGTMGKSAMDCLPGDPVMTDNADLDDADNSQENNSFEKSDEDFITAPFARIGKGGINPTSATIATQNPTSATSATQKPTSATSATQNPTSATSATEAPTSSGNVTGTKSVTVKAGDIVTLSVKAKSDSLISAYRMTTNYDSSAFSMYTSFSSDGVDTLGSSKGTEIVNTDTAGQIKTAVLAPDDSPYSISTAERLQMIKLKAKKSGTYKITYTVDEMFDANGNDLVTNGKPVSGLTLSVLSGIYTPVAPTTGSASATFNAGDTVTYNVDFSFTKNLYGFKTDIGYDSTLLEVKNVSFPNFGGETVYNTETDGKISTVGVGTPTEVYDFKTQKNLVTVTFTAKKAGTCNITYLMKEAIARDLIENYDESTGKAITTDVTSSATVKVSGETPTEEKTTGPVEEATTASTTVTVKEGDTVNYWVKVYVPSSVTDMCGWTVDMYYDTTMFKVNSDFADGNGFASGTAAINYALGKSSTAVALPGGNMTQGTFETAGVASFSDMHPTGLGMSGKTTKLICIQLVALKDGTGTLAYRMRDLIDSNLKPYVDEAYQATGSVSFAHEVEVIQAEQPTYVMGDLNKDGKVTYADVVIWTHIYKTGNTPDEYQLAVGDLNGSGKFELVDRTKLIKLIS